MNLDNQITELKGIGEKSANLFHKLNIFTLKDLLFYFPRDYETFGAPKPSGAAAEGEVGTFRLRIIETGSVKKVCNLSLLTIMAQDEGGMVQITYFNMPYMRNVLKPGSVHLFRGQIRRKGTLQYLDQPRIYKEEEYRELMHGIRPRYSLTKGITNQGITKAVKQLMENCPLPPDGLPEHIREQFGFLSRREAFYNIHFPESREKMIQARKRLAFDEFLSFLLMVRKSRECSEAEPNHFPMIETADTVRLLEHLPYKLTGAQLRTWAEIKSDLCGRTCMNRLIQGDVGSGKTAVALLALLMCAANGYQGAMMAPTEVLARQHYETFCDFTAKYNLPFKPVLLVGSMTAKEKRQAYEEIASGTANLVLGTHAIIQEKVEFQNLALVITDEQHRFGVRQRETLAGKGTLPGKIPHVLVMSATPIPRTLAIILYGDLHLSVIDELPGERLPIKNCVVGTNYRQTAYKFIEGEVKKGRQAYVICPMVEEGEMEGLENVVDYTEKLRAGLPDTIQIAYLHGKMRPAEKTRIMEAFAAKDIDVLVSTTVIEVGINVPNATVMMVENAERFGLAQLHQLRGRVGRGAHQSYCIFVSGNDNAETKKRLEILNQSNDGFYIAGEDLKMRGPGDLFGIRQSGELAFKIGDIYNDADVLKIAGEYAEQLLSEEREADRESREIIQNYFSNSHFNVVDFKTI